MESRGNRGEDMIPAIRWAGFRETTGVILICHGGSSRGKHLGEIVVFVVVDYDLEICHGLRLC